MGRRNRVVAPSNLRKCKINNNAKEKDRPQKKKKKKKTGTSPSFVEQLFKRNKYMEVKDQPAKK